MTMTTKQKAPKHLSPATRPWWQSVVETYVLEPHHIKILTLAAEAFDRSVQAREVLESEGLVILDRFGQPKAHPAVNIERDARIGFARLLRELQLDVDPPMDPRVPRL